MAPLKLNEPVSLADFKAREADGCPGCVFCEEELNAN